MTQDRSALDSCNGSKAHGASKAMHAHHLPLGKCLFLCHCLVKGLLFISYVLLHALQIQ